MDLGVLPMGDWSMSMTLSMPSKPVIRRCFPGRRRDRYTFCISARSSTSCTSVDFPDPLTPVTQMRSPSGNPTSIRLRLCSRAPSRRSHRPGAGLRLISGVGICRRPVRKAPVNESRSRSSP